MIELNKRRGEQNAWTMRGDTNYLVDPSGKIVATITRGSFRDGTWTDGQSEYIDLESAMSAVEGRFK